MTRPARPTPGPDRRGRASGAAASAGRKQAKRAAEGAVAASTGGVGKAALALLPSPLDSPDEKAKKKRRRRIIYAAIAAFLVALTFVAFTIVNVVSSAVLGGIISSTAPFNAGQCVEANARGGGADAPRPTRGNGQMGYPVDPDIPETSPFGPRWGSFHDGLDFGGPIGTPIYAVADGVVKESGPASGYGNWIIIEHEIDGEIVDSLYGHMQSDGLHVKAGDQVEAGQHIADIGNEGFSTGAHLHFGVYPGGWAQGAGVDPKPWLDRLREQAPDSESRDDDEGSDTRSRQVSNRQDRDAGQPAGTVTAADWDKLAQCESGGNWSIDTGNGYSGGLQFALETWTAFGGTEYAPTAGQATREQQMEVANKVLAEQGWSAWPACTSGTYPELRDLKPAPPGTFVSGSDDDNRGRELPPTPAEVGSEDQLQVDAVRGMRTVVAQFPEVKTIGGWRSNGGGSTDHPSGRAIDAMVPMDSAGRELGDRIADYFIEHAEELNVVSVIWQQRYWEGGQWSDMADEGDPTQNHMDHVHVSFQGNGAPNADTSYESLGGRPERSEGRRSTRLSGSDDELLAMDLTPEQQITIKAIIVKAKESDLDNQEQAAALAVMLSGHQANFINMDADDNVNKVGIFAQAPFAGTSQQQLMDPMRAAKTFMDRLEEVAADRPGWADEPGQDVLIEMYPERAALEQELERWEPLAAGIVDELWDDENAQAGRRLERLPKEQVGCAVGAGQALNDGAVPPEFVKWIELGAQVCDAIDAPLLAAQLDAESGFNPRAVSWVGAQGPAQFMPYTWPQWGSPRDENGKPTGPVGTGDPFKISDAVMAQADFMCALSDQIGGWIDDGSVKGDLMELTIAAYNAGPGAVKNAGGMPSGGDYTTQTQPYVAKIMAGREKFAGAGNAGSGRSKKPSGSRAASRGDIGAMALEAARKYEGVPYSWGGKTPAALDCSGLISLAFRDIGYIVPHGTKAQIEVGQEVSVDEARPGDVVFSRFEGNGPEHVAFVAEPGVSYYEAQMDGVPVGEFQRWADDSVVMRYTADDLEPAPEAA